MRNRSEGGPSNASEAVLCCAALFPGAIAQGIEPLFEPPEVLEFSVLVLVT